MGVFLQLSITHVLFYVITGLWILEFVIFPSKYSSDDYSELKTFKQILFTIVFTIIITIVFTFFDWFRMPESTHQAFYYIGIVFYLLGLILRYSGSIYLGQYFTRNVAVSKDQTLVSNGPYKRLRHPLYLGLFLLTVSVPLFFGQLIILGIAILIMGHVLNKRMRLEEKSMEAILGNKYTTWKQKRYRFIPWIY